MFKNKIILLIIGLIFLISCSTKTKTNNIHIIKFNRHELLTKDNYIVPIKITEFGYLGDSINTNKIISEIKNNEQNIAKTFTYDEIVELQNSYSEKLNNILKEITNKYNRKLTYYKIDFKI